MISKLKVILTFLGLISTSTFAGTYDVVDNETYSLNATSITIHELLDDFKDSSEEVQVEKYIELLKRYRQIEAQESQPCEACRG